jgi:2',3'-cyclic-nucleotide 2'-phosphodiesterase (5'-nucleotidase family)
MKKVSLSLFVLSVAVIILARYYPEPRLMNVEGGNFRVSASAGGQGASGVRTLLASAQEKVDSIKRPVIGEAAVALDKYLPESPLMNFAADALLEMSQRHSAVPVDVAITNKGGLRSTIQQGVITFGDVYDVFPFENTLALLTLTGTQLQQLCREVASVGGEAISGMRMQITPQGELLSVTVNGEPLDPEREYRIATSDYLSQGNDKMNALALGTGRDILSNITIRDLMVQYIKELAGRGEKLSAECDGRITVIE